MAKRRKKAPAPAPATWTRRVELHARWIAAALLLLFAAMAWSAVREKSTTFDEMAHLTGGYSYWTTRDYRLHPENGILPQRWASLPLLAMGLKFPDTDQAIWQRSDVWDLGKQFFYELGNDLDRMLWWGRGMIVLFGVCLGAIVYCWSSRLFGVWGGLLSLAIYTFCPTMLAHSALATSDVTAALAFLAALGTFWMALHRVNWPTLGLSGAAMGALFVSKFSAVLILPIAMLLVGLRLAAGRPMIVAVGKKRVITDRNRQLAVLLGVLAFQALAVVLTIWLFFGFRFATFRQAEPGVDQMLIGVTTTELSSHSGLGPFIRLADELRLLPEPYLHGFAFTLALSKARVAFLNGMHSTTGWRMFFPYCLLVKTPLPIFGLLAAAAAVALRVWRASRGADNPHREANRRWLQRLGYRTAPLWVFFLVYWAVAISSNLNIGHRHILPTYPVMFIFCGLAAYWFTSRTKLATAIVAGLLLLLVVDSLRIYPHYLAYFNQLGGGPAHGYRQLVDSSLDWGQDLPGLKRWLDERQPRSMQGKPVYLSYFGTGSPPYYGIDAHLLYGYPDWWRKEVFPYEPGTYCISASMLQSVFSRARGEWNQAYEEQYQQDKQAETEMAERLRADPGLLERMRDDPDKADEVIDWNETLKRYDELRLARLCAYLRRREPDDSVGYSILIYYLDEQDLDAALNRSPLEWDNRAAGF
jgi:hypothetical protein